MHGGTGGQTDRRTGRQAGRHIPSLAHIHICIHLHREDLEATAAKRQRLEGTGGEGLDDQIMSDINGASDGVTDTIEVETSVRKTIQMGRMDDSDDDDSEDNGSGLSYSKAIIARDGTRIEKDGKEMCHIEDNAVLICDTMSTV